MSKDKYLEKFEKAKSKGINKGFKRGLKYEEPDKPNEYQGLIKEADEKLDYIRHDPEYREKLHSDPEERGEINGLAHKMLKEGSKYGSPNHALRAAELYDALGKGNSPAVKNRLIKSVEIAKKDGDEGQYKEVERWLETKSRKPKETKSLENLTKTSEVSAGILGIAGALFFLSPNITGNTIGGMSLSTAGLLGALCFVGGLVLLSFGIKK